MVWKKLAFSVTFFIFILLPGCARLNNASPVAIKASPSSTQTQDVSPTRTLTQEIITTADLEEEKMPVIFSHGGGPCDIAALVFLTKNPRVDLIGLVLSYGEIHPINALDDWPVFLYEVLDYESAALGLGSETPLDPNGHAFPEEWRSGADDFWGLELPPSIETVEPVEGYQLLINLINASPKKVTLLVMGAQTDVALALMNDPGIVDNIANIVIMGGAFTIRGNLDEGPELSTNTVAEWNMYVDPLAADIVFSSGAPVSIVPLDAIQYLVQLDDLETMIAIDDPGVSYAAQMWMQQWAWSERRGFLIWDTITATAVTNPENFTWIYDGVDVITELGDQQGQTVPLNNGYGNVRYAVDADYDAILGLIFDVLRDDPNAVGSDMLITELAGTWEGDTGNFHITFILESDCRLNEKCGTFEIPEFSLTGDVSIVDVNGGIYEFKASNLSSGQAGNEYEYLQVLEDGNLRYHTEGSGVTNEAILYRK